MIDGFPRSGNTTAVYAFWRGNPEVPLAHHLHAPAEVKRAVDRGLPALVLVREPAAAISSLILYQGGVMRPRLGVAAYIAFHRDTLPLANGFAVCTFDQLLADIGLPAKILNRRFGTSFLELEIRQDAAAEIRRAIAHTQLGRGDPERKWSVPSDKRKGLRDEVVEAVRAEPAFTEAEELFASFAALAQEPFA